MKKLILIVIMAVCSLVAAAQEQSEKKLILKNGTTLTGIVEVQTDGSYQLKTVAGDILYFAPSEVERVIDATKKEMNNPPKKRQEKDYVISQNKTVLNTNNSTYPGMRYREYKDSYNTRNYVQQPGDPYAPFWIGFGDFFISGLGNAVAGEWGRAAGFFFSNLGLGALALSQVHVVNDYNYVSYYYYTNLFWVIVAARIGMNIWSICDAVHVAKVKNMYNQDLRAQRTSLDFKIEPFFAYAPTGISSNNYTPAAGLTMKLSF